MKLKNFTLYLGALLFLAVPIVHQAQSLNTGTGPGWDNLNPSSPLVIDEDFKGYEMFHTDQNPNEGNSDNVLDEETLEIVSGYKTMTVQVPYIGAESVSATFVFDSCAFAPDWATAYGYRDAGSNDESANTEGVSNGFVEISRDYPSSPPTLPGYFEVDLRTLEYVEGIQYSHSSTGGNKRGLMVLFSLDDGAVWDTLRFQPGNSWDQSFTKDPFTGEKTYNGYRCDPSAYGMLWEEGLYSENVMLRFVEGGGQTPRIHDLKVYGDVATNVTYSQANAFKLNYNNGWLKVSETVDLDIYTITGSLIRKIDNSRLVDLRTMKSGIYLVKAASGSKIMTTKIIID